VGLPSILRETLDALAAVVFPAPCRICNATLATASRIPVCASCLEALRPIMGAMCACCGRPFVSPVAAAGAQPLCHLCRRKVYDFNAARSFTPYDDHATRAVVLLKYHRVAPLADWFAARLADVVREHKIAGDAVVPVPLHPTRQRERGYNQAELIARPLAKRLGLPLLPALLVRTKPRPQKHRLTRKERWTSVRGAYGAREGTRVDKQRVILVDDVFTTGATLDACSRALRKAGAAEVIGVTVARVVPRGELLHLPPAAPSQGMDAGASSRI
jgi:ComF family protein